MSYGFGIIGLGVIADFHAKAIQAINKAKLVACYDIRKDITKTFGEKHQCTGYSSLDEFLSHPDLDIVTICTPSGLHLEPSIEAIRKGKHIIIEKPLEITLDRCDRIIEASEKKGVKTAVIYPTRFYESSKVIKEAVNKGRFGKLVLGDAYVKWYRTQEYYDNGDWRGTWKFDGGGALMNQSIHAIDLLQWYMGPVKSVQAFTATMGHQRIEVEDNAVAILQYANGALGVIEGSTTSYPGTFKKIELSGTSGSIILEEQHLSVWNFAKENDEDNAIRKRFSTENKTGGGISDPKAISFLGHQLQFEDIIRAIETNTQPLINAKEGRKSVEIILAIYESAKQGKIIHLPL